jgi:hypothetical protein
MTFVVSALFTYGLIEWFASPTEAHSPSPPELMEFEPPVEAGPPDLPVQAVAFAPELASELYVVPEGEPIGPALAPQAGVRTSTC